MERGRSIHDQYALAGLGANGGLLQRIAEVFQYDAGRRSARRPKDRPVRRGRRIDSRCRRRAAVPGNSDRHRSGSPGASSALSKPRPGRAQIVGAYDHRPAAEGHRRQQLGQNLIADRIVPAYLLIDRGLARSTQRIRSCCTRLTGDFGSIPGRAEMGSCSQDTTLPDPRASASPPRCVCRSCSAPQASSETA